MRILIVDDHEMIRRGVRALLEAAGNCEPCGEAVDGQDALEKARQLKPDLILMDISMPRLNGLEATREIRRFLPETDVIILSQHQSEEILKQAISAGAQGYVDKSAVSRDLLAAIESVRRHDSFFGRRRGPAADTHLDAQEVVQRSAALEQALRETEEQFRSTFEQAAIGLAHVSPAGHWLRVNQRFSEIVGYSKAELLRMTVQDLMHKGNLAAEMEANRTMLAGGLDRYAIEERFVRNDGSSIWVSRTVSAVRDESGKVKYFISSVEDITKRKQGSEQLRASQERLALAQRAGKSGTFEFHVRNNLNVWSQEIEELYGMEPGEFGGTQEHFLACVLPEDRSHVEAIAQEGLRTGAFSGEFRIRRRRDGQVRWVSAQGKAFYDAAGQPESLIGINVDITDRKQAEEAQFRLAAIVESSDDAMISTDLTGIITSWNTGAQKLFGFSASEAIGQPINIIIPPESEEEERQALDRFRKGHRVEHRATLRRNKYGARLPVELTIVPVRDSDGRIVGVSKVVRATTGRDGYREAS